MVIDVPDHLGQKGRDSMREQLDRIWDEFRAEQPLPPTPQAPPPPPLRRRYDEVREEPRPRWREPQHITRVQEMPEDRPQRDTRRAPERSQEVRELSAMEVMEERLAKTLRSMEDMERRQEARESRESTVTNPRPVPEIMVNRGLAAYTGEGEPSNLTIFTSFTKSNPVHFKGQLPTPFAYGRESLKEFRIRYTAFAVSSGWSGPNQVSIMLRCLEQGPLNTFLEWIEKGFLRGMDVDRMWRLMEEKFCDPGSERRTAKSELAHRIQERGESTLAYEQVFLKLAAKAGLSEEEKVEKWLENVHPSVSKAIKLLGAEGGELTFERAAKIARRVDLADEERPPPLQTAVRRSVHAVTMAQEEAATSVNAVRHDTVLAAQEAQTRTIQAIREAISVDMKRELASQSRQMEDGLKRKLDSMQSFQSIQHQKQLQQQQHHHHQQQQQQLQQALFNMNPYQQQLYYAYLMQQQQQQNNGAVPNMADPSLLMPGTTAMPTNLNILNNNNSSNNNSQSSSKGMSSISKAMIESTLSNIISKS